MLGDQIGSELAVHCLLVDLARSGTSSSRNFVEVPALGEEGDELATEDKDKIFAGAVESTGRFWAAQ